MMLFSSCGKSPSLLEPKQTEVVESPEEMYPGAGITYKDLGVVALVYLVGMPLFSFLKECALNQRAFRFKNNTPYMLVNPYASPPDHYVEVVNYNKNAPPGPVASLNIGTKVDGKPVLKEIRGSIPKPA